MRRNDAGKPATGDVVWKIIVGKEAWELSSVIQRDVLWQSTWMRVLGHTVENYSETYMSA